MFEALNYSEHFLVFVSAVSGYVSTDAFASLFDVLWGIVSSAVAIKISSITSAIKKYKSIIKKKKRKHILIMKNLLQSIMR